MYVFKRDGRKVSFEKEKIIQAQYGAFNEVYNALGKDYNKDIAIKIADLIRNNSNEEFMEVEDIQDKIENYLIEFNEKEVSKAYHNYRVKRSLIRERNSKIMKKVINRNNSTNIENSNANVDERSFSGREKEASGEVQKILALDYDLPEDISQAHQEMLIYQHDIDKASLGEHNCLNLNFKRIFKYGFTTRNGDVRPPKSVTTVMQLYAVAFQCQSQVK